MELKINERIDDLEYKGLKIIQNSKKFCFGIDSVILSDFAKNIKSGSTVLDLGTGTGIISILLCGKTNLKEIIGIEIQQDMCEMANRSIILNNLQNKFKIINDDIKNINKIFLGKNIDVIVTNPPYKKENSGLKSENESQRIARHEVKCNLEDIIRNSANVLKDKGEFYMVHKPERLADITQNLRKYKLEPKIIKFVYSKINEDAKLVLIKAVKHANSFLKVEKPLIIYTDKGEYTEEYLKIYNK